MDARDWIRTVDDYVEACFLMRTPPRVSELAILMEMATPTLSRRFTRATNVRLLDYIRAKKLACAISLLMTSDEPLEEIAPRAGFGSRSSFFREFSEALDLSPAQFREMGRISHHHDS